MRRLLTSAVLSVSVLAGTLVALPAAAEVAPPPTAASPPETALPDSPEPMARPKSATGPADSSVSQPPPAAAPPVDAPQAKEWFTPTTRFQRNDDGTVTADITNGARYRRDGNGVWHATRPSLGAGRDAAWPLTSPHGYRPVHFGRSASALLRVDLPGGSVSMSAPGLKVGNPAGDGRFARYHGVARDTDLVFEPGAGGVKQELVLRTPDAPRSFRFHLSDPQGLLGDAVKNPDGGYTFAGEIGQGVKLRLLPAMAYEKPADAKAEPVPAPGSAHLSVTRAGDGWDITEWVDESWLRGKKFPIVLDPYLYYSGSSQTDCYIVSDNYSTQNNCAAGAVIAGNGPGGEPLGSCGTGTPKWCIQRGLLDFNVNNLPRGSNVTAARLKMWQFNNQNSNGYYIGLYNNDTPFNSMATWERPALGQTWNGGDSGAYQDEAWINANNTDQYRFWYLGLYNIVETWRNTGVNGGLMLRARPEPRSQIEPDAGRVAGFYSNTVADSAKWPEFRVTYTPPPAPTVTKTVAPATGYTTSANGFHARNSVATYTVQLTSSVTQDDVKLEDVLPAGTTVLGSTIKLDGVVCSGCVSGNMVTKSGIDFVAGQTRTITYNALLTGTDERSCSTLVNAATAISLGGGTNTGNTASGSATAVVCDVGLGIEPWWSYFERPVNAAGDVKVNVANGNAVVTQVDSTSTQGRGDLAFGLRRTYNSQDARAVSLPGGLSKGWQLNFGEVSSGYGSTPSGLVVPPLATLAKTLPIVLVDRDGTRHTFNPRGTTMPLTRVLKVQDLTKPVSQWKFVPETGVLSSLVPKALDQAIDTVASGYTSVCIDVSYAAPDGVHLGLWRYFAIDDNGASAPCKSDDPNAVAGPKLLGFASVRTDRFRNEFTWDGRLVSQSDAAGNEFRYQYGTTLPLAGVATGPLTKVYDASHCSAADVADPAKKCRTFTLAYSNGKLATVTDPAGRVMTYTYDAAGELYRVTNPDNTYVEYTYAPADARCAATGQALLAGQLCTIRDERGYYTYLKYNSSTASKIGPVASVTDRRGTTTAFSYPTSAQTDVVTNAVQKRSFKTIDTAGRVGQVVDSDLNGLNSKTYHQTDFYWDTTDCRFPTTDPDNNLCRVVRESFDARADATPDSQTKFKYNDEGQLLAEGRTDGTTTLTTTYGYETQFVQSSARTKVADTVSGGGGFTSGSRSAAAAVDLLYTVSDRTQSLTPRGNAATSTDMPEYLTTYHVDNNKDVSTNTAPAATGSEPVICTSTDPAVKSSNTGLTCRVSGPSFDGATATTTRYSYDKHGAKRRMWSPEAMASGQVDRYTEYTYYGATATDTDLSAHGGPAVGWLKGVTDPVQHTDATGEPYRNFVVFGYDRAGNVARTWDRNATKKYADERQVSEPLRLTAATFPPMTAPGYAEVLRGSLSSPWRYVTAQADPLGNRTTYTLDEAGNQQRIRPPRGNLAAADSATTTDDDDYDTDQQFDGTGALVKRITPSGRAAGGAAWQWKYDAYGNQVWESDPLAEQTFHTEAQPVDHNGHTKVMAYDGVNRLTSMRWTRTADSAQAAAGCNVLDGGAPLSGTRYYCETTFAYDGLDNQIGSSDANRQTASAYFDAFGRETKRLTPRDGSTLQLRTDKKYDADGNVTLVCSPREFDAAEHVGEAGWSAATACTTTGRYSTVYTYDVAGREASLSIRRDSTLLTSYKTYNADGVVKTQTAPNGGVTVNTIDLNGRVTATAVPRSSGASYTTTTTYDPSGNVTSTTRPGSPAARVTAFKYDEANRLVETVEGSSSTDAAAAGATSSDGGSNIHSGIRYDADGNVVARLDPRAYRDSSGAPSATPPDSSSSTSFMTRFDVDAEGRVVAEYRPRFDGSPAHGDNPATSEQPSHCTSGKQPTQPVWGARGLPSYTADAPGSVGTAVCVAKTTFDAAGNVVRADLPTQDGNGQRYVTYGYTDDNLLATIETPDPAASAANSTARVTAQTTVYDGAGRALTVKAAAAGVAAYVTTMTYTSDGLVLTRKDGTDDRLTSFTYDYSGNVKTSTVNGAETTSWTYFSDNRTKSMTDPLNKVTTYGYDNNGNPSEVVPPTLQGTTLKRTNTYTLDNLLQEALVPVTSAGEKRRTTYTYDGGGRQLTIDNERLNSSGAVIEDAGTMSFEYYPSDRQSAQRGREPLTRTSITTSYDAAGHPASVTSTPATGTAVTTAMTYYLDGLPRSVTQNGRTVSYAYDGSGALALRSVDDGATEVTRYAHGNAGQVTSVTSDRLPMDTAQNPPVATEISLGYDSAGRLTSQNNPNGTTVTRSYRQDNNVATQVLAKGGTPIASWRYGYYDATGRLKLAARDASSLATCPAVKSDATLPLSGVHCFYYDAAGRLDYFKQPLANTLVEHDGNGNRTTYGGSTFRYSLDDTMSTENGSPHDYDGAGRLESDGSKWYCYDGLDRTREIRVGASSCTGAVSNGVSYTYDGFDRQVTRTETGTSALDPGTTSLFYDGTDSTVLAESRPGSVELDYLPLGGRPVHVEKTGGTAVEQFLTDDGRGNVSTATTGAVGTGVLDCSLRYDPYGTPIGGQSGANPCSTGSTPTSVLFAGERRDAVSGNYQLGSRTYDPGKAAFLTEDVYRGAGSEAAESVGTDPLTMNRYTYVNGDPVNYIDPSGHRPACIDDSPGGRLQCPNQHGFVLVSRTVRDVLTGEDTVEEEIEYCGHAPYRDCGTWSGFRFRATGVASPEDPHENVRKVIAHELGQDRANDTAFLDGLATLLNLIGPGTDALKKIGQFSVERQAAGKQHHALVFDRFARSNGLTAAQLATLLVAIGIDTEKFAVDGVSVPEAAARSTFVNGGAAAVGAGAFAGGAAACGLLSATIVVPVVCGVIGSFVAAKATYSFLRKATDPYARLEPRRCIGGHIQNDPGALSHTAGFPVHC